MSKQIYIDSNGNEVLVSGTVNTADMMPMSGNDSKKVSEAIGDLSTLTTSVKSSLVGAVNEVNGKINGITSVNLDFSISCRTSATGICPYRSSGSEAVNITSLPDYPTGKTILAVIPQYSYLAGLGNMSQPCLVNIYGTTIYAGSYASGDVDVRVTVLYKD